MDTTKLTAALETLPDSYKEKATTLIERMGTVVEGVGDGGIEWRAPFLRLVQGTTDRSTIPRGTAIGDFVIGENRVERPLSFIPLRLWEARQYWNPDQTKNNTLCFSLDSKVGQYGDVCKTCPYSQWVEGEGAACGKTINIYGIASDLSELFTVTFAKSSYSAGMELTSYLKRAGVDPYRRQYNLTALTSTKAKNIEVLKVDLLTDEKLRRTPEGVLPFLKALFDIISADRKTGVEAFYLEVDRKKSSGLALPKPVVADSPLLETSVPSDPGAVSTMAKNFVV